ncbi:hypothetical protein M378DRAFT_16289 [Amanita muscaria Koide BX008]|uniref:U3 small nucleolar RNA-associated protein 13 C-terminal domain-containing protein n=1 Tax=Amanita muscaria (strain Koide BX008) TaxID=946122 RepID=A0A0C2WMF0_AMAMK|nr:hypothetical protein M378DRAFT_16289 [Amanita muscaria Koide BX008]
MPILSDTDLYLPIAGNAQQPIELGELHRLPLAPYRYNEDRSPKPPTAFTRTPSINARSSLRSKRRTCHLRCLSIGIVSIQVVYIVSTSRVTSFFHADSVVTFWEDCTEEQEAEKEAKRAELALKEQDFLNYVSLNDYKRAIELALAMEQLGRLLSLFKNIRSAAGQTPQFLSSFTGHPSVDAVIRSISGSDLAKLLQYVRDWNTNAKTSAVAQTILFAIFKSRSADDIAKAFSSELREDITNGRTPSPRKSR